MPFQIIRNDITKVKADAIVNTANPSVAIGSGVDSAIYKAAGEEKLLAERKKIGWLKPGDVAITPAFDLDAKYIIHVSGPWWEGGDKGEVDLLRKCYDDALKIAADNKCKSIAFPLLATGTYKFPQRLGLEIAVETFTSFLEEHDIEIYLVVFGKESVRISGELGEEIHSFIDDEYVKETLEEEYCSDSRLALESDVESGNTYLDSMKPERLLSIPSFSGVIKNSQDDDVSLEDAEEPTDLEEVLSDIYTETFGKHLQKLINKKGLKNSQVYAAANISKQYFSKLLKGQVKPSKEKVLALAVGLRLNLDEAEDFLRLAGYAFSPISQTDAVVVFFLKKKEYNVSMIDIVLFDYGLDTLSKE